MAQITNEEAVLLNQLRKNVADILTEEQAKDNYFLVRWLRARENLDMAEKMLRNAMEWRKQNGLDKPGRVPPPKDSYFFENYPLWTDGMDREGRPVNTVDFGKWDLRKIVKDGRIDEFSSYITERFEENIRAIKRSAELHSKKDPPITQYVLIVNCANINYMQAFNYQCVQAILKIVAQYESYYPEILFRLYFINCPALYFTQFTLGILSSVASSKTMNKIKLFGTEREEWEKEILKVVEKEQIRPQFGGSKIDDFNPFL